MANSKKEIERKFIESYKELSPEAQKFVYNVTIGMALKHQTTPNLDESLRFYTLRDLVPMFSVSHRTLQTWVAEGYLPTTKVKGKHMISEKELFAFIKEKHIKTIKATQQEEEKNEH